MRGIAAAQGRSLDDRWYPLLLSALLTGTLFLAERRIGLNLSDEGFLWYGSIQTLHGEVPIYDFQAYDPGRYYWSAMWLALLDEGVLSLRLSLAAFQVIGLTLGLLVARRLVPDRPRLAILGLALSLWTLPRHKAFESTIAMGAVYVATVLAEQPSRRVCFAAGAFAGLAAIFGRNHGAYTAAAFALVVLFVSRASPERRNLGGRLGALLAGAVLGYGPMLLMFVLLPGFFNRWADFAAEIVRRGNQNLPLPVPWPWRTAFNEADIIGSLGSLGTGAIFVLYPVFCVAASIRVLQAKGARSAPHGVLLASVAVAVPYAHHAFSRADLSHLAQSIHPMLMGTGALLLAFDLSTRKAVAAWLSFAVGSALIVALPAKPLGQWLRFREHFVARRVAGDTLQLETGMADHLDAVARLLDLHVRGETIWFAPHYPGLYPVFGRQSPVRDLYLILPEWPEHEARLVEDLKHRGVDWALVADVPLDGRDDLRLRRTHPAVWTYLGCAFDEVAVGGLRPNEQLFHRGSRSRCAPLF